MNEKNNKYPLQGKYVIQKNDLIYGDTSVFNVNDLKIFKLIISKVNSRDLLFDKFYEITNEELKALNFNETHLYQNVLTSLKKLANIYIKIDTDEKSNIKGSIKEVGLIQNNFEYKKYSKKFYVSFHNDMKDYLLKIKDNFTKYPIVEISELNLKHSLKLYEYLRSTNLSIFEISIEKLKKRLDIDEASYKQFGGFKNKVLDPAIEQISKTTSLRVTYDLIKDGRKIIKIKFTVNRGNSLIESNPFKKIEINQQHPIVEKLLNKKLNIEDQIYYVSTIDTKTFTVTVVNLNESTDILQMTCSSFDDIELQIGEFLINE